jgi:hypothetical protein
MFSNALYLTPTTQHPNTHVKIESQKIQIFKPIPLEENYKIQQTYTKTHKQFLFKNAPNIKYYMQTIIR